MTDIARHLAGNSLVFLSQSGNWVDMRWLDGHALAFDMCVVLTHPRHMAEEQSVQRRRLARIALLVAAIAVVVACALTFVRI